MTNEILFLAVALLDLTFVLIVARFGKSWLQGAIILNLLLISTFGAKLVSGFGYTSNVGNVFYAVVFFATQLLVERFGKKEGYRSILLGAVSITFFIIMAQFVIAALGSRETHMVNAAIETLFRAAPRVALASVLAYIASQATNIWLFDVLRTRTHKKHAYLRVNASNLVGQLVDSALFFTVAFYGILPGPVFLETLLVGFVLKVGVGVLSTPFFYASFLAGPGMSDSEVSADGQGTLVRTRTLTDWLTQLVVFAVVMIPFLIMGVFGYVGAEKTLTELTVAKRESLAYASAVFLEEKFSHLVHVGASLAGQAEVQSLLQQGRWEEAVRLLEHVPRDFPDVDRVFLADVTGTLMADYPAIPEVRGKNFAFRDWYKGVTADWQPYVSEVYKRAARPQYNVLGISNPIMSAEGERLGILNLQVKLDALQDWNTSIEAGEGGSVIFVDQYGHVASHPRFDPQAEIVDYASVPSVQKLLRGESGTDVVAEPVASEETFVTSRRSGTYGWGVLVAQPVRTAFVSRNVALAALGITYSFVLLVSVILAFILARAIVALRKSREMIQKSEAGLLGAQAIAHMGNFEWDVGSHQVEWSDELYTIYGLNRSEFTPTYETFLQKLHPDSREYVKEKIATALESGQTFEFEETIIRPDGKERILATRGNVVRDAAGKPMKLVGVCLDVTEQKDLEKKLREDKATDDALLASIGEGVVASDNKGRVVFMNVAAKQLLELPERVVMGKPVAAVLALVNDQGKLVPDDDLPFIKVLTGGQAVTAQYYYARPGGARFPVAITVTPVILEDKQIGMIGIFRDVSKEQEVDKAKTEFVSLASHQLRTPLAAINWYLEMLVEKKESFTKQQQKYLAEVAAGSTRMTNLVSALLNVSRLELGTFSVEPVSVNVPELVKSALRDCAPQVRQKHLSLTEQYDDIPTMMVDEQLMRIIIQNVVSNAVQYTSKGGKVAVSLAREGEQLLFTVSDKGIGIPAHQQGRIFEKLFRADNARMVQATGTGLGLYIVKTILDRVGGAITFTSKENEGTEFRIRLPLSGMHKKAGSKRLGS